jgi:hypothetical protein
MRDNDSILLEKLYLEDVEYRGEHQAPDKEDSAPLHDLTKVYPEDVYSDKAARYYGDNGGDSKDISIFSLVKSYKNKPKARVKIYRAVPKYIEGDIEKIKEIKKKANRYHDLWRLSFYKNDEFKQKFEEFTSQLPKKQKMTINVGDWVTIDKSYAVDHGRSTLLGDYIILSKTVKAEDIYTSGDSIFEWGYDPS